MLKLTENAEKLFEELIQKNSPSKKSIESLQQLFKRLANTFASIEKKEIMKEVESNFYEILSKNLFIPSLRILQNAITNKMISSFSAIQLPNNIIELMDQLKTFAVLQQNNIPVSFDIDNTISKIIHFEQNDSLYKTIALANQISQLANLESYKALNSITISIHHPKILEFLDIIKGQLNNFSSFAFYISFTDEFLNAAKKKKSYNIIDSISKKILDKKDAVEIFSLICNLIWEIGYPKIIFIDTINKSNPLHKIENIKVLSPCGEQPLYNFETSYLGAINLVNFVKDNTFDYKKLKEVVQIAIRFLDNAIDIDSNNQKETPVKNISLLNRKIGLGVMGFADMLIKLGIRYDSKKAISLAEKIMKTIKEESLKASEKLGFEKGSFPNLNQSSLKSKFKYLRNIATTAISHTDSVSTISNCTSGIEPIFAVAFVRKSLKGNEFIDYNITLEEILKKKKLWDQNISKEIINESSIKNNPKIPDEIKSLFLTAYDINHESQILLTSAFQKYTDGAVSKNIFLPKEATVEDIKNAIFLAHKMKLKSISFFRNGCKKESFLKILPDDTGRIIVSNNFAGGDPLTVNNF